MMANCGAKVLSHAMKTLRSHEKALYKFTGLAQTNNYSTRRRHEDFVAEDPPVPYAGNFPRAEHRVNDNFVEPLLAPEAVVEKVNNAIQSDNPGRLFAIVQVCGRQFKVTTDDIISIQGLWAPDVGDRVRLEKVLLAGSSSYTLVGRPLLPKDMVNIEATVIEKTLSYTQLFFVLKKRKDYRRLKFGKTPMTMIRINAVDVVGLVDEFKEVEGLRPNTVV